jgi:SAM-dependent methyltransferase
MDPIVLKPYGLALKAYFHGQSAAQLTIRRDDGIEESMPVSQFFRSPTEFSAIEQAALERCRGSVLDVGAGSGVHSLAMQSKGITVTAVDISPLAVEIMVERGVRDVHCADILRFPGGPFDTILLLGHGVGMVEDLPGLDRFLTHARQLTGSGGQLLLHSLDVRQTEDPKHLAYHEANLRAGRYVGEIRFQFEYEGHSGPYLSWLQVDLQTLREQAESTGWNCEMIMEPVGGEYLACLTRT